MIDVIFGLSTVFSLFPKESIPQKNTQCTCLKVGWAESNPQSSINYTSVSWKSMSHIVSLVNRDLSLDHGASL